MRRWQIAPLSLSHQRGLRRRIGMSKYRILVLGGGYTGIVVAGQLARRMPRDGASVTLVTGSATRDERMRWHQLATGQTYPLLSIPDALKGSGAQVEIAHIEHIDLAQLSVHLGGREPLAYDSLVVALGSVIDTDSVPGVRAHAHGLTDVASITTAAGKLAAAPDGTRVVVVGGGLTGIELVTEIAEAYPRLQVSTVSSRTPGDWLSAAGRQHLERTLDGFGVERIIGRVTSIGEASVGLADGRDVPSALTFWAGGFRANPLVASSGLAVDELGRAYVDQTFRTVDHPDVWVVGDAARVAGRDGEPLKMGCRTGAFMALSAPQMIVRQLGGGEARPFSGRYFAECISLGRHDALLQWLTPEGEPTERIMTGRSAMAMKEFIHRGNQFVPRHPGPYMPARRAHLASATGARREMIET